MHLRHQSLRLPLAKPSIVEGQNFGKVSAQDKRTERILLTHDKFTNHGRTICSIDPRPTELWG